MKKLILPLLIGIAYLFQGCDDSSSEFVTYSINEPVFMPLTEFRNSVKVADQPQEIKKQGKICFYDGYLYVSEPEKGIHIIDNRNPASPQNIGFVELIGNVDLAIRNNMLYADSYIDLVWFDINNPAKPVLKGRLESAFPNALPTICNEYGIDFYKTYYQSGITGVVIGWNLVERKEKIDHSREDLVNDVGSNYGGTKGGNGITGSMARFGIYQDYLYTVINNYLSIFNISGSQPQKAIESIYTGYNVETLFNYKDKLFMGTPTGLLIYSVENPLAPERKCFIGHVWGCDPVVVENDIAYVTVRSGNVCGQNVNELMLIDVKNVEAPKPIVTYTMTNPKGLGIDNGILFLCDDGLKIYDAQDPLTLMGKRLAHYSGMNAFDVIPFNNVLMMIAEDGIYQYDYKDLNQIKQLSKIAIKN